MCLEAEKQRPGPACSGDFAGDHRQARIHSALEIVLTFGRYDDSVTYSPVFSGQHCTSDRTVFTITLFVLARFHDGFDAALIPVHQVAVNFAELDLLQSVGAGFVMKPYHPQGSYGKREVRITVACPSTSE